MSDDCALCPGGLHCDIMYGCAYSRPSHNEAIKHMAPMEMDMNNTHTTFPDHDQWRTTYWRGNTACGHQDPTATHAELKIYSNHGWMDAGTYQLPAERHRLEQVGRALACAYRCGEAARSREILGLLKGRS